MFSAKELTIYGTILIFLLTLIAWAAVAMNAWENDCEDRGGEVVSEYLYTLQGTDYYNYYCMKDGVEI